MKLKFIVLIVCCIVIGTKPIYSQKNNSNTLMIVRSNIDTTQLNSKYSPEIIEALLNLRINESTYWFKNVYDLKNLQEDIDIAENRIEMIEYTSDKNIDRNIDSILSRDLKLIKNKIEEYNYQLRVHVIKENKNIYSFEFSFSETAGSINNTSKSRKNGCTVFIDNRIQNNSHQVAEKFLSEFGTIFPKSISDFDLIKLKLIKRHKIRNYTSILGYSLGLGGILYGYFGDLTKGHNLYEKYSKFTNPNQFIQECPECIDRPSTLVKANDLRKRGQSYINIGLGVTVGVTIFNLIHKKLDPDLPKNSNISLKATENSVSFVYKF